jgi:polar amino acid transport system substrate-binding protein
LISPRLTSIVCATYVVRQAFNGAWGGFMGIFRSMAGVLAVSGVLVAPPNGASAETRAQRSNAQSIAAVAKELAPTGKLRVAVLMLTYFAVEEEGKLKGWSPDLGVELARRLKVPYELVPIQNPADMIDALSNGKADVTFIGITKDRADAFDFGPVVIGLRTTFLVPSRSSIRTIPDVDQVGVRIVVPARSAQGEHLEKIIKNATLLRVPVETTKPATDLIAEGKAEAFSHVVPMLVAAQASLPGSRILPGSYYDVPIAIGYPKGRSGAAAEFCKKFVEDMKSSGFAKKAISKMGTKAQGVVVAE